MPFVHIHWGSCLSKKLSSFFVYWLPSNCFALLQDSVNFFLNRYRLFIAKWKFKDDIQKKIINLVNFLSHNKERKKFINFFRHTKKKYQSGISLFVVAVATYIVYCFHFSTLSPLHFGKIHKVERIHQQSTALREWLVEWCWKGT